MTVNAPADFRRELAERLYGQTWDRVAELTRQGHSAAEIAGILGVTKRTVQRARERRGVQQKDHSVSPMTEAERARALELFADGASVTEVARTLGRAPKTIYRHFGEYSWSKEQITESRVMAIKFKQL